MQHRAATLTLVLTLSGAAACGKTAGKAGEAEAASTGSTTGGVGGTTGTESGSTTSLPTGILQQGGSEGEGALVAHPADCNQVCNGNVVPINDSNITSQYCPNTTPVGTAVPCEGFCYVAESLLPTWLNEPPCSGPVYPQYDYQWGEHTQPLSRGAYVHNMAHGFIIIAYNCPGGCDADLATLRSVLQQSAGARVILTPDPLLTTTPYAAMAWTWSYKFTKPDPASLLCFIAQHNTNGWPH